MVNKKSAVSGGTLTAKERKQVEQGLKSIDERIKLLKKQKELTSQKHDIMLQHYNYSDTYEPTMEYQTAEGFLSLCKELDSIKWSMELVAIQNEIDNLESRRKHYVDDLKARG
jgi:hypothetical protein